MEELSVGEEATNQLGARPGGQHHHFFACVSTFYPYERRSDTFQLAGGLSLLPFFVALQEGVIRGGGGDAGVQGPAGPARRRRACGGPAGLWR